jgi:ribosomal protein L11 methyltransferase
LLAVVAASVASSGEAVAALRRRGAASISTWDRGRGRVLVYGGPFDAAPAVQAVAALRADGWAADVKPTRAGHLTAWRTHTAPVTIGDLAVCFPWCEAERTTMTVEIDPGSAFGNGSHPSTWLLLSELVRRLRPGDSVLDVGCGSGVLAICAARLGAGRVAATDISETAVASTRQNAERNGVIVSFDVTGTFDVVLANVTAPVLCDLAPSLTGSLKRGGWLGVSGISPGQVSKVAAAFAGLATVGEPTRGEWSALILSST